MKHEPHGDSQETKCDGICETIHKVLLAPQEPVAHAVKVAEDRKGVHPNAHTKDRAEEVKVVWPSPDPLQPMGGHWKPQGQHGSNVPPTETRRTVQAVRQQQQDRHCNAGQQLTHAQPAERAGSKNINKVRNQQKKGQPRGGPDRLRSPLAQISDKTWLAQSNESTQNKGKAQQNCRELIRGKVNLQQDNRLGRGREGNENNKEDCCLLHDFPLFVLLCSPIGVGQIPGAEVYISQGNELHMTKLLQVLLEAGEITDQHDNVVLRRKLLTSGRPNTISGKCSDSFRVPVPVIERQIIDQQLECLRGSTV